MRLACPGLFSCLENGSSIVTPSRLLSAVARQQLSQDRLQEGHASWRPADVLSLNGWLQRCWQDARYESADTPALLSTAQEQLLWKQVIASYRQDLFNPDSVAAMARRAADKLCEWELPVVGFGGRERGESFEFQQWFGDFEKRCEANGWIARSRVWRHLRSWLSGNNSDCGQVVFLTTGPASPAVKRAIKEFDSRFEQRLLLPGRAGAASGKACEDFAEQLDFVARQARFLVDQNRTASIGVFVPNLAEHAAQIELTFRRVLYPGSCLSLLAQTPVDASEPACHVHGGNPPHAQPLVAGALLLLNLARPRIAIADATAILRSPWISGVREERNQRALADLTLRKRRELDCTFEDLQAAVVQCPALAKIFRKLRRVPPATALRTYSAWSERIAELLRILGWPGDADLDARDQRALDSWSSALSQLSSLAFVAPEVPFDTAVAELRQLLAGYGAETDLWAPIQVFDARESAGLSFDAAILVGMDEESWPPSIQREPLLPPAMLAGCGSDPVAERDRLTRWLFATAAELTVTWSDRLSPVIAPLVTGRITAATWNGKSTWQTFKPVLLDETNDTQGPAFAGGATTRGGTGIIKAQSLCPFRAFAEYRLRATAPEEGCLGLDSRDRGGHLHAVLEVVWQRLRTHDNLVSAAPLYLHNLVEECAREVVDSRGGSPFHDVVTAVEVERLKEIVLDWLEIEKKRQQSFSVETVEQERYFDLAGLRLRLRLDRIDRLANGQLLLIDYKSGDQTANKLEGERPQEPQLLVYAASLEGDVAGLFFAQLTPRDPKLKGISQSRHVAGTGNQVKKDWDTFLLQGKASVHELATQFKAGHAAVDPIKFACDFCRQKALCRIQERVDTEEDD